MVYCVDLLRCCICSEVCLVLGFADQTNPCLWYRINGTNNKQTRSFELVHDLFETN